MVLLRSFLFSLEKCIMMGDFIASRQKGLFTPVSRVENGGKSPLSQPSLLQKV